MASRDKADVDMFHKSIQYALEKRGKSKSGFERTVVSKFKRKRHVGSGNEIGTALAISFLMSPSLDLITLVWFPSMLNKTKEKLKFLC